MNVIIKQIIVAFILQEILKMQLPGQDPCVVSEVKKFLIPPSPLPYNLNMNAAYRRGGETLLPYIKKLFSAETRGVFVEAGGLDGQYLSNSLWLEQNRGWQGLLAEPGPENFQLLRTKHRHCWTSNTCFSRQNYATDITLVTPKLQAKDKRGSTGLGMSIRGGAHEAGVQPDEGSLRFWRRNKAVSSSSKAKCFPLISYLLALNISKIDFLSLDVQGAELDILKTLPWDDTLKIRVVVAEVVVESYGRRVEEFMVGKGFVVLSRGFDYWFAKKGDPVIARV